MESTLELAEKSFGLSLSDCYWINDEADPKSWADVNFFDNDFSDDLGFLALGQDSGGSSHDASDYAGIDLSSPPIAACAPELSLWDSCGFRGIVLARLPACPKPSSRFSRVN